MRYAKPYLTIPQQISRLKARGLVIDDEAKAESYLRHIG
jgi:abortive infection bacteriophage resistance protein